MELQRDILLKYAERAAIDQLTQEYVAQGYKVLTPSRAKGIEADLIVRKGKEIIVFEVKARPWTESRRNAAVHLRDRAVRDLKAKYKIVLVTLPEEAEILLDGIEAVFSELLSEQFIDEFSRLATHFWIDEVTDTKYSLLHLRETELEITGSSTVTVGLQYGSDGDYRRGDGVRFHESFGFSFHITLDRGMRLRQVITLELDRPQDLEEQSDG